MGSVSEGTAPDFYNLYAKERGAPDGWRWYSLQVIGDVTDRANSVYQIKGAVCTAVYKSGRLKGHTNWTKRDRSTERDYIVTPSAFDEFVAKWETATGRCSRCGGDGKELQSCGIDGNTYRPCRRCSASGKAPVTNG